MTGVPAPPARDRQPSPSRPGRLRGGPPEGRRGSKSGTCGSASPKGGAIPAGLHSATAGRQAACTKERL